MSLLNDRVDQDWLAGDPLPLRTLLNFKPFFYRSQQGICIASQHELSEL